MRAGAAGVDQLDPVLHQRLAADGADRPHAERDHVVGRGRLKTARPDDQAFAAVLIPEAEEKIQLRLQELKQSLTIDEQRAMLSLPPLAAGKGNVFVVGNVVYDGNWKAVNSEMSSRAGL